MKTLVIVAFLATINLADLFFVYNDCDMKCVKQKESCVISEMTKEYFPCICLESELACSMLASRIVVCLQPNGEVDGGESIWEDFENHRKATTTTPRPDPDNHQSRSTRIPIGLFAGFLSLVCVISVFVKRVLKRREYERIRHNNDE